ncbi:NERD domain-containing protein [Pseudoalteromonas sp. '520P1 No. 423']|uniref:NERD domain-containing protein n=3 Tax=unclassified Pseudoalteromonas TaxID=194690 RepID=UPI0018D13922|nr:NERD domain-containing protein [Pseudoalteromonas sp. '520P1 No. 423']
MCILLKQQVQQFSHAKQSRSYRQAKRAFDQGCYRAKVNKSSTQPVSNKTKTAKEIPTEVKPIGVTPVEVLPAEVMPVEVMPVEVKAVEVKPIGVKPVTQEVKNTAPVIPNSSSKSTLLDAYLMPTLVLVCVLLLVIFSLFYIKPRAGKLKNSVKAIKSKAENIKIEHAEKKHNKEKSIIKPISKKRPVAKKRKKDELDKDIYKSFKQLELRLENKELVKVERITVSPYGIFVIASQTQTGGIFGGLNSDKWTSKTGDKTLEFNNPIKDVKQKSAALAKFLEVKIEIQLIVLFDDATEFKAPMPAAVMNRSKLNTYIKSFKELVLSDDDFEDYAQLINNKVTADWNKSQNNGHPEEYKTAPLINNLEEKPKVTHSASEDQQMNQTSNQNLSDGVINNSDIPKQEESAKPLSLEETLNELYKNEAHIATQHVEEPEDNKVEEVVVNLHETNNTDNTVEEELTQLPTEDEFLASLEMPELSNEKENEETLTNIEAKQIASSESDEILAEIEQAKKELDSYLDEPNSKPQSSIEAVSDDIIEQLASIAQGQNELPPQAKVVDKVSDIEVKDLNQADDALASYLESESNSEDVSEITLEVDIQSNDELKQADDALASYLESELDDSNNLENDLSHDTLEVEVHSADDFKQADDALASYLESELDDSNNLENDLSHDTLEVEVHSADDFKQADDALASYLESELDDSNNLENDLSHDAVEVNTQSVDDLKQAQTSHKVSESSDLFSNLSLDPTWAADSKETPKNPTLGNTDKSLKIENKSDVSSLSNITLDENWDEKPKE